MKILFITPRVPYPINKGDKLRAYYFLKILKKKHEIALFSIDYESTAVNIDKLTEISNHFFCHRISKLQILFNILLTPFRNLPFQVSFFYNIKTKKKIEKLVESFNPDVIFCQLIRTSELVKDIKSVPKILDYVDAISEGLKRRKKKASLLLRFFLEIEYKKVKEYERQIFNNFEKKIIITNHDKQCMPLSEKASLIVIPNGVDSNKFKPDSQCTKEYDLLFTGNMEYPPNVKAAIFIVKQILPLVQKKYKNIKVLIVGANPTPAVLSLSSGSVKVLGWVEDIREYYSKARIFLAPLQIGTGLQNKVLEAMSMALPVITTNLVQKGIEAPKDSTILVSESAEEFANSILRLMENQRFVEELGSNAREFILKNYTWAIIEKKIEKLFNE